MVNKTHHYSRTEVIEYDTDAESLDLGSCGAALPGSSKVHLGVLKRHSDNNLYSLVIVTLRQYGNV